MLKEGRPGLTDAQKAELWRRWKAGQSMDQICDALGRTRSAARYHLFQSGGLLPRIRRRPAIAALETREKDQPFGSNGGR
jgi:hypothetical protein